MNLDAWTEIEAISCLVQENGFLDNRNLKTVEILTDDSHFFSSISDTISHK